MELLVIFVIIFIIYGAGWIWQTVNDILRDANRVQWDGPSGAAPRPARVLLGGHDLTELNRAYQRFAETRAGELHNRQLFQSPKVSFTHHGARALLSIYEPGDSTGLLHTQLTYTVPEGWPYRLEVFPQRRPDEGVSTPNDIRIGDDEFDRRYVVKANDAKFAREYLDGAARQALEDLRNLLGNDRILVSLNSSRLMVRKESVISDADDLAVFADLACRLQDRIEVFWQRASGIEILDESAPRDRRRRPDLPDLRLRNRPRGPRQLPPLQHAPPQGLLGVQRAVLHVRLRGEAIRHREEVNPKSKIPNPKTGPIR